MEASNMKAMREALEWVDDCLKRRRVVSAHEIGALRTQIAAALAKPPRQCDVGTAEEQAERYGRYCEKFTSDGMHCESCPCCGKIPFGKCEFAWAQMPYEGGAK